MIPRSFFSTQFLVWLVIFFVVWGGGILLALELDLAIPWAYVLGTLSIVLLDPVLDRITDWYIEANEVDADVA